MEEQWSGKKVLFIWLAIIAVIVGVIGFFHYFPQYANHPVLDIVGYVIVGVGFLAVVGMILYLAYTFPKAIVLDLKRFRKKRQAKSEAYRMIFAGKIYNYDRFEQVREILTTATLGDDREAELLLWELQKLKDNLEENNKVRSKEDHLSSVPKHAIRQ